ncbi:MAG: DUF2062 domain-containing protein [Paracoccaceae bacterium]|nr:DUF2062 domain-containing protein [Paracoccaceae bacterium]MDG2258659.1 DUF2062 domain-containing protein [Paracoccaceae bacterium]
MVFKRREKRSYGQLVAHLVYPRGGWSRAVQYIRHRVNRLPDSPERIARGIFAGVLTAFTPFYGLHFILAYLIAKAMRANVFAALTATFFGNPLTYFPIAVLSIRIGNFLVGTGGVDEDKQGIMHKFGQATDDLWDNFKAIFTHREAHWDRLIDFYDQVFYPFMIGGIIPGVITGLIAYYLSVPVIRAYQKRRTAKRRAKFIAAQEKAKHAADEV